MSEFQEDYVQIVLTKFQNVIIIDIVPKRYFNFGGGRRKVKNHAKSEKKRT